ncbi:MAG: hypothetical protein RL338_1650 [Chloroflexota bacterium]
MFEFHVSREARVRYGLDAALFGLTGNLLLADFAATRALADRMNERREAARHPERAVLAGRLNAMGLIDEILHHVVALYREGIDRRAIGRALAALEAELGRPAVDGLLVAFADRFPTAAAHRDGTAATEWLAGATGGIPHREIVLEELVLCWLANANPAFAPYAELFDDAALERTTAYGEAIGALVRHFEERPPFGPDAQPLVTMLRAPAIAHPDSLAGQLRWIREHWGLLLGRFLDRLVLGLDVLAEDERAAWLRLHGGQGDGRGRGERPGLGPGLGDGEEPERFSRDLDWMPRLVLLAKSTYVWLDQLSRTYGREIRTLDAIPDEELDRLARWGISGLWLIGLWERSRASQEIKRRRGNPEAVASAYSLMDYRIAADLGGDPAWASLRDRARARGIRLASDMVPNHMGIDSTWVVEHPERFLSLPYPPYPSYAYEGPDLSTDDRVAIHLEDHYWDSSDAAVTFKRVDRRSGEVRYVYHGNDGTSFPWNDTAQLDYLNPATREAVIETILEVARRFPVIRFDAAMTLAKRHIQRLWFPEPGAGGGIPSRAEHGLPKADFDARMPVEFWREVVDRVAAEAPDTLLLAEAFWMLEGYFVRTLGMHRVYNSAFMHMLRDEENAGYRRLVKETLEFDPEILKRYVNFMNNPDEETAVEQFGRGDKYFGIATLMVTLPGLPMFGHGQVEGFAEKYGMEYRRAYRDEAPDAALVERHEREIFPLLHRRERFAEVAGFTFYDLETDGGAVDENVFAYSNLRDGEASLVVYHNRFGETAGRIRRSVAFVDRAGGSKALRHRSLAEGLGLPGDDGAWVVLRDERGGLEYLRSVRELREDGLRVSLDAYRAQVFVEIRVVGDDAPGDGGRRGAYARLAERLGGRGVPSIAEALRELELEPVHGPVRAALRAATAAVGGPAAAGRREPGAVDAAALDASISSALAAVGAAIGGAADPAASRRLADEAAASIRAVGVAVAAAEIAFREVGAAADAPTLAVLAILRAVGAAARPGDAPGTGCRAAVDDLRLRPLLAEALRDAGADDGDAWWRTGLLVALAGLPPIAATGAAAKTAGVALAAWFGDDGIRSVVRVNRWDGTEWFEREPFEALARLASLESLAGAVAAGARGAPLRRAASRVAAVDAAIRAAGADAGYRVEAATGRYSPRTKRRSVAIGGEPKARTSSRCSR